MLLFENIDNNNSIQTNKNYLTSFSKTNLYYMKFFQNNMHLGF